MDHSLGHAVATPKKQDDDQDYLLGEGFKRKLQNDV